MDRIRTALVKTVGGWQFSVGFTQIQAFKALNARPDDVIRLNETDETITFYPNGTVGHRKRAARAYTLTEGAMTSEDLVTESLNEVLNKMIEDRAWDKDEETDHWEDED